MFLFIARHAWAYEFGDARWRDDSERELEPEGAERYATMVTALAERGFAPEVIATSPYARCRQTADLIAKHTPHNPQVTELAALAPGSNWEELISWSRATGKKNICWVGHTPDVDCFTAALVGSQRANIRFAKGAIAAVRYHSQIDISCGELYWHVTAKSLGF